MDAVVPRSGPQVLAGLCVAVLGLSCSPTLRNVERARPQSSQAYLAQFDELWSRFDEVYPSFDVKHIDWKAQRAVYRPRAGRARSQSEFVAIASKMLEPLRDLHVWFIDPRGQVVPTFRPSGEANFDEARWRRALRDAGYVSRGNDFGEANVGGYGYLFIGSWRGTTDVAALDLALARARDLPGLIVDVRTNGGGDDATALAFASRFTATSFAASYVQTRNGPAHEQLEPLTARTIAPRGAWQFLKPVVVIAGRAGYSATESFVAALRTLPNVTVIGDTTGGASGNPATFALGGGWSYTVPQWIEYGPDRGPIEWHGVAPHVVVPWTPSSYDRDRDPLVDAAVGVLAERNGVFRVAPAAKDAPPGPSNASYLRPRLRVQPPRP
jgi:carboxyl-terminal processing protease